MGKLFVILSVIVVVALLVTSCSLPPVSSNAQGKDTDVLSGNDVTLADVTVNVDSRDFSRTDIRTCGSALQVDRNSCGITIEAAP